MSCCPKCGKQTNSSDKFCMSCGEKLEESKKEEKTKGFEVSKKLLVVIVIAIAVCIAAFVVAKFTILRPTNFLNISWDSTPSEAVEIIEKEIKKSGIEYLKSANNSIFFIKGDPFFGFEDVTMAVSVSYDETTLELSSISFLPMPGSFSTREYDDAVERLSKIYGEPSEIDKSKAEAKIIKTIWHLPETDIEMRKADKVISFDFYPCNS